MKIELQKIMEKASIDLKEDTNVFLLKSKFRIFNKFNFGLLLIAAASIFSIVISILESEHWGTLAFGLLLGSIFFVFSMLTIIKELTDFIMITDSEIHFMNSLRRRIFALDPNMKIRMAGRTEYTEWVSQVGPGLYTRTIELFLIKEDEEFRIFNFLVDDKDSRKANVLGSEIIRRIKKKINASKKISNP